MTIEAAERFRTGVLSVAPMMDRTDRHYRFFLRQISRHVRLYTEMVTTHAILNGPRDKLLAYDPEEHFLALQVGGDDPKDLAEVAKIAEDYGYDEINLNVGCPSDRVQSGCFGAVLMRTPERVAKGVAAMRAKTNIAVTVKHRIGVDELDRYEDMANFVATVAKSGCTQFAVHARKAWLNGLSPKENRTIPPLRYDDVYRLKAEFPELTIEINGGITTLDEVDVHLAHVDAVMIGRAAYDNPYLFASVDRRYYGAKTPVLSRHEVVERMVPYVERQIAEGTRLHSVTRHMLGLFVGQRGARAFKRHLSENATKKDATAQTLLDAVALVPPIDEPQGATSSM